MSKEIKILITTISTALMIGFVVYFFNPAEKKIEQPVVKNIPSVPLIRSYNQKIGVNNAAVTVVEFYDPECEACGAFHPVMKKILKEFEGKIQLVVRYTLFHGNSTLATKASEAAGMQGKFWEYHDLLFDRQEEWSHKEEPQTELMIKYAKSLKLNLKKFTTDLESLETLNVINTDLEDGKALGVRGTPTFFVNGKRLEELSEDNLRAMIGGELGQNLFRPNDDKN